MFRWGAAFDRTHAPAARIHPSPSSDCHHHVIDCLVHLNRFGHRIVGSTQPHKDFSRTKLYGYEMASGLAAIAAIICLNQIVDFNQVDVMCRQAKTSRHEMKRRHFSASLLRFLRTFVHLRRVPLRSIQHRVIYTSVSVGKVHAALARGWPWRGGDKGQGTARCLGGCKVERVRLGQRVRVDCIKV